MEKYQKGLGEFSTHTTFEVRDGSKIRFLHCRWCGDQVLKEAFSDLSNIAHVNDAFVVNYLEISSNSHQWNIISTRAAHNWEVDVFALFLIYCTPLDRVREVKTSFVRPPPREACLMLDCSITSLSLTKVLLSLGSVFGGVRFP